MPPESSEGRDLLVHMGEQLIAKLEAQLIDLLQFEQEARQYQATPEVVK
jgi:hypothetical protein